MGTNAVAESAGERDCTVMGSIEDGPVQRFIVADVTRDGAFATIALDDAASLPAWR